MALLKLPKGVTRTIDRHGKERWRYRRKGIDFYLPCHPQSKEGKALIEQADKGFVPRKERTIPKTIGDLCQRFYASARFNKGGEAWRRLVKSALEDLRNEAKNVPVADFTDFHIENILVRRLKKQMVKGRPRGGPAAAERLHEQLIRLFDFAHQKLRWIDYNPARAADSPVGKREGGYHVWTAAEIAQFQERHPIGAKARLAMEIAFWTGLRRGDVAKLGPANINNGRVSAVAGKTGKDLNVLLAPPLAEVIAATETGDETFLVTSYGKPFTDAGLGNWFRDRCNEAGLPHCSIHGLRKALTTIAAESGATQQEIKALGGWSNDREVATYTAKANAQLLADAALRKVIEARTLSNQPKRLDK